MLSVYRTIKYLPIVLVQGRFSGDTSILHDFRFGAAGQNVVLVAGLCSYRGPVHRVMGVGQSPRFVLNFIHACKIVVLQP